MRYQYRFKIKRSELKWWRKLQFVFMLPYLLYLQERANRELDELYRVLAVLESLEDDDD